MKYEVAAVFDHDGKMLFDPVEGTPVSVDLTDEEWEIARGKIVIHNHPSEFPFSEADILNAQKYGVTLVAVTPSGIWYEVKGATLPAKGIEKLAKSLEQTYKTVKSEEDQKRREGKPLLNEKEQARRTWNMQVEIFSEQKNVVSFRRSSIWEEI
jgi:hypothetical protein